MSKISKHREVHFGDLLFHQTLRFFALALPFLLGLIVLSLLTESQESMSRFGWNFFIDTAWDPVHEKFGALAFIFGTIISSTLALLLSAPISVAVALLFSELAPKKIAIALGFLIEMLAAIPSVVYGLWGIFVLAPWMQESAQPFLGNHLGFLPLFQGPPYGVGMLTAGIILAIMITPTITSIAREVFHSIPRIQREAALALGATPWEMMKLSVLKSARSGIFGATILGLGRALGETMAVTMVIGNRPQISASLFAPAQTMSSILANEYAEAMSSIHISALVEVGLVLFIVTFIINALARLFVWRSTLGTSPR